MARYRLTESALRNIIRESIQQILTETTPEYYDNAADKAHKATTGLRGWMSKKFTPNTYNKRLRQERDFKDMADNHPQDTWELCGKGTDGNRMDTYTIRNQRTGEKNRLNWNRWNNDSYRTFRGNVVLGQPEHEPTYEYEKYDQSDVDNINKEYRHMRGYRY